MFVKVISAPLIIVKLETLLRRLPFDHPKRKNIEEMLARRKAGYKGEKSLEFYLSQNPADQFLIFHNLRLTYKEQKFQIDFLLLSAKQILILEVKNYSGELFFDKEFDQLFRTYKGKMECFPDPIAQVERQHFHLEKWLQHQKLPSLPIEHLVVISNLSTIVRATPGYKKAYETVCKADHLLDKITSFEKKNSQQTWDTKLVGKAKKLFLMNDTMYEDNVLKKFEINQSELLTGVFCPNCNHRPMEFKRSSWFCTNCRHLDHEVHKQAINDYFLLIEPQLTNKKLREFLGVPTQRQANYLLNQLDLHSSGPNKNRIYSPF
ncbi:MAG: nuclease-related domain-containing protein [Bacillota bacterium]|nr:nuclease-related domain-containing protein [Bacillota bacterium]